MTKHIHCDNCGKSVPFGTKVWAYGSMRYCNGKCLGAAFHENQLEPKKPKKPKRVQDWTAARLSHLEEERLKHAE